MPGGDVNPYLAVAGMIAAGLHGIDQKLELEEACTGNAYTGDAAHVPTTLREAAELWEDSAIAREAFGADVVDALPQHGARGAAGVRHGRHGLGAFPVLRAHVRTRLCRTSTRTHELPVVNPATEELITTVAAAGPADVDAAVRRAAAAQRALGGARPG